MASTTKQLTKGFRRLQRHFRGQTVVLPAKNDKGKLVAKNMKKHVGALDSMWGIGYSHNRFGNGYTNPVNYQGNNRLYLMYEYDLMERDPIISRALTILAQESCLPDQYDNIIQIDTEDEEVRVTLEHLFYEILNIDNTLAPTIRQMMKYGDSFWYLDLQDGIGITDAVILGSTDVEREEDPVTGVTKFELSQMNHDGQLGEENIAHFRNAISIEYLPYGVSHLESIRKYWKMQQLLEDFMMVYYMLRSVNQRVFRVDVGNLDPEKVPDFIHKIKEMYKKKPLVDSSTLEYDLYYDPINVLQDIILPVREGYDNTQFDEIPASPETNIPDGLTILRQKIMAGLGVPNFLLNYEETVNSRSTAAGEDIRFAKSVESIQKIIVSELEKIAVIHLILQGYTKKQVLSFSIGLTSPSNLHEMEKLELLEKQTDIADRLKEGGFFSKDFIYKNIYKLTDSDIVELKAQIQADLIEEATREKLVEKSVEALETSSEQGQEDGEDLELDADQPRSGEGSQGGQVEPSGGMDSMQRQAPEGRVEDLLGQRSSGAPERRGTETDDRQR